MSLKRMPPMPATSDREEVIAKGSGALLKTSTIFTPMPLSISDVMAVAQSAAGTDEAMRPTRSADAAEQLRVMAHRLLLGYRDYLQDQWQETAKEGTKGSLAVVYARLTRYLDAVIGDVEARIALAEHGPAAAEVNEPQTVGNTDSDEINQA